MIGDVVIVIVEGIDWDCVYYVGENFVVQISVIWNVCGDVIGIQVIVEEIVVEMEVILFQGVLIDLINIWVE